MVFHARASNKIVVLTIPWSLLLLKYFAQIQMTSFCNILSVVTSAAKCKLLKYSLSRRKVCFSSGKYQRYGLCRQHLWSVRTIIRLSLFSLWRIALKRHRSLTCTENDNKQLAVNALQSCNCNYQIYTSAICLLYDGLYSLFEYTNYIRQ